MDKPQFQTHKGDRVRIKDNVTHMYRSARVFNEAHVKACQRDDQGYPMIYVEWDKDHWAYSGEDDGWALEAHFDLVKEKMEDKQNDLLAALAALVQNFSGESSDKPDADHEDENELGYEDVLKNAFAAALNGEAFIVLVASPTEFKGTEMVIPQIYMRSKRDDAAIMLDATMADAAAQAHAGLVLETIAKAKDDGDSRS